ncbi:hypothetical protein CTRI78_v006008 [Colletotrichum trifolii]|uniref:Uncharacterized protein n=1 Tax=Colletotrichum trifolii TaxID=5466 RepID=A0A4R8RDD6_COLTR|nr:hypothetical protein CTRI78_v006008 [Colletotrichum trifolii]
MQPSEVTASNSRTRFARLVLVALRLPYGASGMVIRPRPFSPITIGDAMLRRDAACCSLLLLLLLLHLQPSRCWPDIGMSARTLAISPAAFDKHRISAGTYCCNRSLSPYGIAGLAFALVTTLSEDPWIWLRPISQ